jgi:glutaredoxin
MPCPEFSNIARLPFFLVLAAALMACQGGGPNRESGSGKVANSTDAAPRLDRPGVLYVWVDAEGTFKTTEAPAEIPASARGLVRVLAPDHSSGSESSVWVIDLRAPSPTPRAFPRTEWEAQGKGVREARIAQARPAPVEPEKVAALGIQATIYGASWCKPCHLAEEYLKHKGAKVTKKDIEEDARAGEEMRGKLRSAGLSGASIPVLDVGGTILVGFSAHAIDQALALAGRKP